MNLSQAYLKYPFTRASRTRAGFGHPNADANFRKFWLWVKRNEPQVWNAVRQNYPHLTTQEGRAAESGPPGLGQLVSDPTRIYTYELGADETPAIAKTSWGDKLMAIASPLISVYQQKKIMDLQIKRAERGLEPIDVSTAMAPKVVVQAELPEELKPKQTWIMPALIIGGLFLAFRR